MVHTCNFYLRLTKKDIKELSKRHSEIVYLIGNKIDEIFKWSHTKIYYGYSEEGYSRNTWVLELCVDFIKLLGKSDINETDFEKIEEEIDRYQLKLFGHTIYKFTMVRLDYRIDIKLEKQDREILLKMYRKSYQKYGRKKIEKKDTTIYFQSKSISLIMYDKPKERIDKGFEVQPYEKDILRMEVSLKNKHLNYKKRKYHIPKELKVYFKSEFYKRYIKDNLNTFIHKGDHYKINQSEEVINNSDLKDKDKKFIREFLVDVSKSNLTFIMEMKNEKGENKYTIYKRKKALKILEELNINPILIPKNWKCKSCIKGLLSY